MSLRDHARDGARRLFGWIWRRVWARIENRLQPIEDRLQTIEERLQPIEDRRQPVEDRHQPIEERLQRVEQLDAAWNQHVPAFLNAVATVGAFGHELAILRRRVAAAEAAAASHAAAPGERADDTAEAPGRHSPAPLAFNGTAVLALSGPELKLNLGCGHAPISGYVNVDRRALPGVDIVAPIEDVPVEPDSVAEIYSAHLLEHVPQEALRRQLLPYWRSLLRPDGLLRAVVPDGSAMIAGVAEGSYPFDDFRRDLFGAQENESDYRHNLLTPDSLRALLLEAGFTDIAVATRGRTDGRRFEFEIVARKPSSGPAATQRTQ